MSTPRVLLGRSFTCPREASTEKPFPRYFWMVFALAGDSTMTKPFDNFSSICLDYVFEASTNSKRVTSYGQEPQIRSRCNSNHPNVLFRSLELMQNAFANVPHSPVLPYTMRNLRSIPARFILEVVCARLWPKTETLT